MIYQLKPSKAPFKTPEFGNSEHIAYLRGEEKKAKRRGEVQKIMENTKLLKSAEITIVDCEGSCGTQIEAAECPNCGQIEDTFYGLTTLVEWHERTFHCCNSCGEPLTKY